MRQRTWSTAWVVSRFSSPSWRPRLPSPPPPSHVRLLRPGSRGAPAGQRGDGALGADRSGIVPPRIRERWRPRRRRSRRHVRGRHPPQAGTVAQRDRDRDGEPDVVSCWSWRERERESWKAKETKRSVDFLRPSPPSPFFFSTSSSKKKKLTRFWIFYRCYHDGDTLLFGHAPHFEHDDHHHGEEGGHDKKH